MAGLLNDNVFANPFEIEMVIVIHSFFGQPIDIRVDGCRLLYNLALRIISRFISSLLQAFSPIGRGKYAAQVYVLKSLW